MFNVCFFNDGLFRQTESFPQMNSLFRQTRCLVPIDKIIAEKESHKEELLISGFIISTKNINSCSELGRKQSLEFILV